jgi:MinD-like ATPase involved in chromosome partitioning or flagellar assembly
VIVIKILVALDNKEIKEKLNIKYGNKVYNYDFSYKEDVIEYLKRYSDDYIILTRLDLPGNISYKEYILSLKKLSNKSKIVIILNKLNIDDRKFLYANEIFNIIEGNEIDIDVIYNQIETEDKVVYKTIYKQPNEHNTKRSIAVLGTNGAGKSFVSYLIANSIAKYTKKDVALISMDSKNSCQEILGNINCIDYETSEYINEISKNEENIEKYVNQSNYYKNLWYIISKNNYNQKNNNNINIKKFIENLENKYNYVVFDTSTCYLNTDVSQLIDWVDEIIFVINPNYISLKQAKFLLEFLSNSLNVKNNKIKIVVNKIGDFSLDIRQIKSILKLDNKIMNIKYLKMLEGYINGIIYDNVFCHKLQERLFEFLSIK